MLSARPLPLWGREPDFLYVGGQTHTHEEASKRLRQVLPIGHWEVELSQKYAERVKGRLESVSNGGVARIGVIGPYASPVAMKPVALSWIR
jgi:hypothetical protein